MKAREKLPTTSYGVLGILTSGEASGYDLAKAIDRSIGFFFAPAKSHLYAELRRLVEVGYATEREVEQTGRPDKRVYAITPAGEEALRTWIAEGPVEPDAIRSTFLLRIFFGHLTQPETVIGHVLEYRRQTEELLGEYRSIERTIEEKGGLRHPSLTLKFGIAFAEAALRWCEETLRELEEGGER